MYTQLIVRYSIRVRGVTDNYNWDKIPSKTEKETY